MMEDLTKLQIIVGHTMQYHPHGDAKISDAIVQIGQKDLLIETQGIGEMFLTGIVAGTNILRQGYLNLPSGSIFKS